MKRDDSHFRYGWRGIGDLRKDLRKDLRQHATAAEQILWNELRAKRLDGLKFRRQHGIANWIVDFYNGKTRTVVELDGSVHDDAEVQKVDKARQIYLEDIGCSVLRFSNEQVVHHLDSVLESIQKHLAKKETQSP